MNPPSEQPPSGEPRLSEAEQRVVEALAAARATVRAPDHLRTRIDAQRPSPGWVARRRVAYGGAMAGALAAIVLAAVLILPAGAPAGPSVSQAAALALRGPAAPAPPPDPKAPSVRLHRDVQEVYFPNWTARFGWRAVGERTDLVDGRTAATVYYEWRGKRVAYTIVDAPPLKTPSVPSVQVGGTDLRTLSLGGRSVVTWERKGHTCVLSGTGVSPAELQKLAAWKVPADSD